MAGPFALRLVASEAGFKRRGPMSVALEVLARQFLHSPPSDRTRLLSRVMASLDSDSGINSKWVVVAAQRTVKALAAETGVLGHPRNCFGNRNRAQRLPCTYVVRTLRP